MQLERRKEKIRSLFLYFSRSRMKEMTTGKKKTRPQPTILSPSSYKNEKPGKRGAAPPSLPHHHQFQYLGTFGSTNREYASIPPLTLKTLSKPACCTKKLLTCIDRMPWWQRTTVCA